ncbi:protein rep [Helicobacter sp. NHP21005]|uniref:protein rep n=1 Tax=Helicobacter felistomachi TaxID=3040201 RepID=UPI0025744CD0|nr:protein rep [Helicobacter sp. NHP21005]BEG57290.1 protein rep [Helicobacter sp. NHP21005]
MTDNLQLEDLKPDNKKVVLELLVESLEQLEKLNDRKYQSMLFNAINRYPDNPKKAQRCCECGEFLLFSIYENIQTKEKKRILKSANFCKIRYCPMCMARKATQTAAQIYSILEQIQANHDVEFISLTLTIKNAPLEQLRADSKLMSRAWDRMVHTKQWQDSVLSFVRSVEFKGKKTRKREHHAHFHCTLLVRPDYYDIDKPYYIKHSEWVDMWQKALRVDYRPSVRVKRIRPKNKKTNALLSAVLECVKYSVKPSQVINLNQEEFRLLDQQTRGLRQYNKGGLVKQYKPKPLKKLDPEIWKEIEQEFWA